MFKLTHEFSTELDIPIEKSWDLTTNPQNWPKISNYYESCSLEGKFETGKTIRIKIRNWKNAYVVFHLTKVIPYTTYSCSIKGFLAHQESTCTYQALSSTRTKITIHTTLKSFLILFFKSYTFRFLDAQYSSYPQTLIDLYSSSENVSLNKLNDHKNWVSGIFDRAAAGYGKGSSSFFNYFGKRLLEQVHVPTGSHGLDVATGKGAILFPLAQAVGPNGKVVGIDISQQMLKETAKEIKEKNISWIDLEHMDAEQLNFPDNCFDVVFCGFALFFLPSIPAALSEFKRVLKSGGTLAVSTWGENSELGTWVNEEIKNLCKTNSLVASPLWSETELQQALTNADFKNIQIVEESKVFFHTTAEEWWQSLWNHGTRAKFEQLAPDQLTALHEKGIKKANDLNKGHGVAEKLHVFYGIAQKN